MRGSSWLLPSPRRVAFGVALAVGSVVALSPALYPFQGHLDGAVFGLAFLLPTVLAAVTGGPLAAAVGIATGFAAYNFLFTRPYYTFAVAHIEDVVGLSVYLLVGAVVAWIVIREQRAADSAARHEAETRVLSEVDRLRSALMGAVSHDLRTPLASISVAVSHLQDAREAFETPADETLLDTIATEARRLDRLVSNLLDVGRVEADAVQLEREMVEVDELIDDAVRQLGPTLHDRRLDIDLAPDLAPVFVDPTLISQVLTNLLENAHRYSPSDASVRLSVVARDDWAVVRVQDHGPGVPPLECDAIFEPYYRVRSSAPIRAGSGVGLAICKSFVEAHGGKVWVEPAAGGGASFGFELPLGHRADLATTGRT